MFSRSFILITEYRGRGAPYPREALFVTSLSAYRLSIALSPPCRFETKTLKDFGVSFDDLDALPAPRSSSDRLISILLIAKDLARYLVADPAVSQVHEFFLVPFWAG